MLRGLVWEENGILVQGPQWNGNEWNTGVGIGKILRELLVELIIFTLDALLG